MPIDPDRPLLQLPKGALRRRTAKGNQPYFPKGNSAPQQALRLGPKFERLRRVLSGSATGVQLVDDPTALAPETIVVFEVKTSLVVFSDAVSAIPGLEFIAEDDDQLTDDDGGPVAGHYYAVFADQAALRQMLSLWDRWQRGDTLDDPFKAWANVFACLHDLRRWGPKDRVSETHAETFGRLAGEMADGETIHVEIELVFHGGGKADGARSQLREILSALGAHEVAAARHEGFAYDALLIEVPKETASALSRRENHEFLRLEQAFRIRPQSIGQGIRSEGTEATPAREVAGAPGGAPFVAVVDAVPVQNHPLLAGRVIVSDPDSLESLAAGPRHHGTAMVSLVIHGDLKGTDPAVSRPIYFRPIMVDSANIQDFPLERTLPNRLLVDDIVRIVRRMKVGEGGQPAEAPDVAVVNLSFGIPDLIFDGTMSPLARCLDWLAWQYGILFVVSAGNASEPLVIKAFPDDIAFAAADLSARTGATLAALRDVKPHQALLSPAEAINVLTVGALHADNINAGATLGSSYDPLPQGLLPSIVSRLGLGFRRAIKPDLLAPGGRLRVHLRPTARPIAYTRAVPPSRFGGIQVAGPIVDASGPQAAWTGCTSAAAALTTHALHLISDALEQAYGDRFTTLDARLRALLLKTLLVHRVAWPAQDAALIEAIFSDGQKRHANTQREEIARLYGFGMLDQDASRSCAYDRATGWGVGTLTSDAGQIFRLPLPQDLIGERAQKVLTVTACWFTPILPGRQSYRGVKLRIDEKESDFGDALKSLGTKTSKEQHSAKQTWRGTAVHRRYEGQAAAKYDEGDAFEFKISRMFDDQEEEAPEVPFAVAVSLEAAGIPVYDQVLAQIDLNIRPQVPQPVIVGAGAAGAP